jgi:hypothetical protein
MCYRGSDGHCLGLFCMYMAFLIKIRDHRYEFVTSTLLYRVIGGVVAKISVHH